MPKKKLDPESEAAMEVAAMEENRVATARQEQEQRQAMLARAHEMAGQIKGVAMLKEFAGISTTIWLHQMKESKFYKELGTWEEFCKYIGISREKADLDIGNLCTLGEDFLRTVNALNVGYRDLRKLRQLTADGGVVVEQNAVVIGEERIPLDADHRDDLAAAMEKLLENKDKKIGDLQATVRAKDKVLEAKEGVIQRQEREIQTMEAAAKLARPQNEDEFLKKMGAWQTTMEALLFQFQDQPLPKTATPRMRAALLSALAYNARISSAIFKECEEQFGEAGVDYDTWDPGPSTGDGIYPEDLPEEPVDERPNHQ